jgi:hypothetical protein
VCAVAGGVVRIALVSEKRCYRMASFENDRASGAATAAFGLSLESAFCPQKRGNPRTTVSGAEADTNTVDEHDRST